MGAKRKIPSPLYIDPSSYEDIIETGRLKDRITLFIKDKTSKLLTEEQRERLVNSFQKETEQKAKRTATEFYVACVQYGRHLLTLRKFYQTEVEGLIRLYALWKSYDREAEMLNTLLQKIYEGSIITKGLDLNNPTKVLKFLSEFWKAPEEEAVLTLTSQGEDKNGRPIYKVEADVYKEKGLYTQIDNKLLYTFEALQMLNSGIDVFTDFLLQKRQLAKGVTLTPYKIFLPNSVENILSNPFYSLWMDDAERREVYESKLKERYNRGEMSPNEVQLFEFALKNVYSKLEEDYNLTNPVFIKREQDWVKHYFSKFLKEDGGK